MAKAERKNVTLTVNFRVYGIKARYILLALVLLAYRRQTSSVR